MNRSYTQALLVSFLVHLMTLCQLKTLYGVDEK